MVFDECSCVGSFFYGVKVVEYVVAQTCVVEVNFGVFLEFCYWICVVRLDEFGDVSFLKRRDYLLGFFVVALACVAEFAVVEQFSS